MEQIKKSKNKNKIDFKLLNTLEFGLLNTLGFGQLNNDINNDNILNTTNEKKNKDKKHKKKYKTKDKQDIREQINLNKNVVELKTNDNNNSLSADSDYLEKKFLKNNTLINKKNEIFAIDLKDNNLKNNSKNVLNNKIEEIKQIKSTKLTKSTKSSNPIIQNEVIWYSEELNSDELELKYKNKFNNINFNHINEIKQDENKLHKTNVNNLFDNLKIDEQIFEVDEINEIDEIDVIDEIDENKNIIINHKDISKISLITDTTKVGEYINNDHQITMIRKTYRRNVDCKKCILECKKKESNIFEYDISCDPNCSSYKIFNNSICCSHIKNVIFMSDGKIYNPELVEIYINGEFIEKFYSDVINNLPNTFYNITDSTYPLSSDTVITLKIQDTKQIDKVFFNVLLEKIIPQGNYFNDSLRLDYISTTHELLYEGTESNIEINLEHGFYQDIWVVCDDIENNINSISMANSDVILFQDIPIQLLEHTKNLLSYSLKIQDQVISGIKIDSDLELKIGLNKSNPNSKVKIYGNKIFILQRGIC